MSLAFVFERTARVVMHTVDVTDLRLLLLLEIPINEDNKIDLKHREGPKGNLYFKTKRFTVNIVNGSNYSRCKVPFCGCRHG